MQVSSATTVAARAAATNNPTSTGTPITTKKTALDQNDFLKLLATQFQNQDPMKPMDDTAYIAQMASFTSLEQAKTTTAEMVKLNTSQSLATANSYLGKLVTVDKGDGTTESDVVSAIMVNATGPQIVVGNNPYSVSSVLYVEPAPAATTPATATTAAGGS